MGAMASPITSITIVYSTVYAGPHQRKHQSSASLAVVTGEFLAQMASNAENVSIWWRYHDKVWVDGINYQFQTSTAQPLKLGNV